MNVLKLKGRYIVPDRYKLCIRRTSTGMLSKFESLPTRIEPDWS